MNLAVLRVIVALVGVIVWAYGAREDHELSRWIGIAIIVVAMFLRFAGPRPSRGSGDAESADR